MSGFTVAPFVPKPRVKTVHSTTRSERDQTAEEINQAILECQAEISQKAAQLGERFAKSPQYFLGRIYGPSNKPLKPRQPNLKNAWAWKLAADEGTRTYPPLMLIFFLMFFSFRGRRGEDAAYGPGT